MFIKIKYNNDFLRIINTENIEGISFVGKDFNNNFYKEDYYELQGKSLGIRISPEQYKELMKIIEEHFELEDISHVNEKVKTYTEKPKKLRDGKFALNDIKENSNGKCK